MASSKEAAIAVLSEAGKALHVEEITKRAVAKGLIEYRGDTPAASMGAAIYTSIKKLGEASEFEQTGPATFKLRHVIAEKKSRSSPEPSSDLDDFPDTPNDPNSRSRLGAAGEHRVISELLLRGYGVCQPTVDTGIDISADKGADSFSIQVKTATRKNNQYNIAIKKKLFDRYPNARYVFVLRDVDHRLEFVMLSYKYLKKKFRGRDTAESQEYYSVRFSKKDGTIFLGKHPVTEHINDWEFYL